MIIEKNLATMNMTLLLGAITHIWTLKSSEKLKCKQESTNEVDKHVVVIMQSNSLGKKSIVRHIPQNISKFSSLFLMISFTSIEVEVVDKRLNRGGGYGQEIPVKYRFCREEKIVQWLTKKNRNGKKIAGM